MSSRGKLKTIEKLSRRELMYALTHQFQDVDFSGKHFCCAVCGTEPGAKFFYICDKCDPPDKERI